MYRKTARSRLPVVFFLLWHRDCYIFADRRAFPTTFVPTGNMKSNAMMTSNKVVFVVNAGSEESAGIPHLLDEIGCIAQTVGSPAELKELLKEEACMAVIMDIDSVVVNNRTIKDLASSFPAIPFLCLSKERLHPELQDSIRDHIYACLSKPVDPDELFYWLKCIQEDDKGI